MLADDRVNMYKIHNITNEKKIDLINLPMTEMYCILPFLLVFFSVPKKIFCKSLTKALLYTLHLRGLVNEKNIFHHSLSLFPWQVFEGATFLVSTSPDLRRTLQATYTVSIHIHSLHNTLVRRMFQSNSFFFRTVPSQNRFLKGYFSDH